MTEYDPEAYDAKEWRDLFARLSQRELRNLTRRAYRRIGKEVRKLAVARLNTTGIQVKGRVGDWDKAIRTHIYSRGGGFLITSRFRGKKGFHLNRQGLEKPIIYWADHGTDQRTHRVRGFVGRPHATGAMPEYGFTTKAEPEMIAKAEDMLWPEIEKATRVSAQKAGFI